MAPDPAKSSSWRDPRVAIENDQQVLDHFGRWPSFHDAEVRQLLLEAHPANRTSSMRVELVTRSMTHIDANVVLRFHGVEDVDLGGFNHCNMLWEIQLRIARPIASDAGDGAASIEVNMPTTYGLEGSFRCARVVVESLTSVA
ncbi:MAG: Imm50 family immunity protein [Planctomycetota bacterium]